MKRIVIIGASSGIGNKLAEILLEQGHVVYGSYRNNEPEIVHTNFHAFPLEVTADDYDMDLLPDEIDGFVYCPGTINLRPFARIKPEVFKEDYNIQVIGGTRTLQEVLPKLKKSNEASVVFFSTVAVQSGFNFHSLVAASKGAIEGLTRSLAAELAPTVRVNAIAPSITNTPLASKLLSSDEKIEANAKRHPLHKIGEPEDIAQMAAFLLSNDSKWMTGQILHVDGGMSSIKG